MNAYYYDGPCHIPPKIIAFGPEIEDYECFCDDYPAEFRYAEGEFRSVRHYKELHKELLFERLNGKHIPEKTAAWNKIVYNVVKRGVQAKFRHHKEMQELLFSTGDALLACCCKSEDWGTGLSAEDPLLKEVNHWPGRNLSGRILMEIRRELLLETKLLDRPFASYTDYCSNLEQPIPVWLLTPAELMQQPEYRTAVKTYSDSLFLPHWKDGFLGINGSSESLLEWDEKHITNMGWGWPLAGFYEMKQEVYEIAHRQDLWLTGHTGYGMTDEEEYMRKIPFAQGQRIKQQVLEESELRRIASECCNRVLWRPNGMILTFEEILQESGKDLSVMGEKDLRMILYRLQKDLEFYDSCLQPVNRAETAIGLQTRLSRSTIVFTCPSCGSKDVVRIRYGLPAPDEHYWEEKNRTDWGGCVIRGNDPTHRCLNCGQRFVKLRIEAETEKGKGRMVL